MDVPIWIDTKPFQTLNCSKERNQNHFSQRNALTGFVAVDKKEKSLWFKFQQAGKKTFRTSWSCPIFTLIKSDGFLRKAFFSSGWTLFLLTSRERERERAASIVTSRVLKKERAVTLWQIGMHSHYAIRERQSCQQQELVKETKGYQVARPRSSSWTLIRGRQRCFIWGLLRRNWTCLKWLAEQHWNDLKRVTSASLWRFLTVSFLICSLRKDQYHTLWFAIIIPTRANVHVKISQCLCETCGECLRWLEHLHPWRCDLPPPGGTRTHPLSFSWCCPGGDGVDLIWSGLEWPLLL